MYNTNVIVHYICTNWISATENNKPALYVRLASIIKSAIQLPWNIRWNYRKKVFCIFINTRQNNIIITSLSLLSRFAKFCCILYKLGQPENVLSEFWSSQLFICHNYDTRLHEAKRKNLKLIFWGSSTCISPACTDIHVYNQ